MSGSYRKRRLFQLLLRGGTMSASMPTELRIFLMLAAVGSPPLRTAGMAAAT